jgi:pimeloyl-ACP methyl ester carboxylesterase
LSIALSVSSARKLPVVNGLSVALVTLIFQRSGVDGWLDDDLAFVRPWGFDLDAITQPVRVVQGRQDLMVPWDHGEWLADNVPAAESWLREDDGNLTLFVRVAPAINDWLLGRF